MSSQENIEIVREVLEKGFGDGDLSVIDRYVASDFIEHQDGAQGTGPDAVKGVIRGLHESFTDMHLVVKDIVAVGDHVWVRVQAHGVNSKPIIGRPATGRSITIDIIDQIRLRDGKLIEHWGVADRFAMLQQLGLLPQPGLAERPEGKAA